MSIGRFARDRTDIDTGAPVDDTDLVRRAQADPREFAALYDRYVDLVYRYCYRRLGNVAAAEDATSTAFFKALSAVSSLDPLAGSFRSWMFTIAHNVVLDQVRARQRRPETTIDGVVEQRDRDPLPEDQVINQDEARRLRLAMTELTHEQQHILELRLAGLNGPEIAAALGRNPGAIRTAQHRAIQRLRSLLSPDRESELQCKESHHGR